MPPLSLLIVAPLALVAAAQPPARPASPVSPAAVATDSLMGPGVSRALATWRAARVRNVRYGLSLDVTARDTARGRVTVRFVRTRPGDAILDFRGPSVRVTSVNGRAAAGVVANGAHVRIPARYLRAGENVVDLRFAALIAPAGASIIRFRDTADSADYLYTLLVPADANALFPCFDQPDLKARVTLALRTRRDWTAVANGAARDSTDDAGGRTFRFAPTAPISTYLVAFAAGPWVTSTQYVGGRRMTMYVRGSRAKEVETDSLMRLNGRALTWLEKYFARPYPFGKYDFVLAPAFPFGGMEHPGAVFYNEEQFIYREPPTLTQRLGRTATIYHEVAHQWFGDLVTMRWFDDLWLKEGFSTYMAAKMQDALDPSSQAWKTFYLRNKPAAYAVDVTEGTTPVWQQLGNLDQAKSNYGAIVYNKAPSILKQLNYVVGDTAFRDGVRLFLRRHAYGNATWRELLAAIGEASGRDLTEWGNQYILRPGVPVLEMKDPGGKWADASYPVTTWDLSQRPAQSGVSGDDPWPVRMDLLVVDSLGSRRQRVTLARRDTFGLPRPHGGFVLPNAGDHAYAVTLLDPASADWLERHIGKVDDALTRAQLWGAMWDMVRETRLAPSRYVALALRELPRERDEQIANVILGRTVRVASKYLNERQRDSVLPGIERMLLATARDTTRTYGIRKSHFDAFVAVAATPSAMTTLDSLLDRPDLAGLPLRAPTRWAIVSALVERAAPGAERRLAEETRRDSTTEGRRRAFVAGAARPDSATKAEYFHRWFADRTLNEEWASASLGAFNAVAHEELTRRYLVPALDSLPWIQQNRRIFFLGNWLGAFLDGQRTPEALAMVVEFLRAHPTLAPDLRAKLLQNADELRRTVAIRRAFAESPVGDSTGMSP